MRNDICVPSVNVINAEPVIIEFTRTRVNSITRLFAVLASLAKSVPDSGQGRFLPGNQSRRGENRFYLSPRNIAIIMRLTIR